MMKIYYKLLFLVLLGILAGGCDTQSPAYLTQVDETFTLKTNLMEGKMVFVGIGGEIDGVINPDLISQAGDTVRVVIINSDSMPHDFAVPELNIQSPMVVGKDYSTDVIFEINEYMSYTYYCDVPGHREAGMEGKLIAESGMPK